MSAERKKHLRGLALVALGVLAFSFTFPATRFALGRVEGQAGGFDPLIVGFGRAVLAFGLAAIAIALASSSRGHPLAQIRALPKGSLVGLLAVGVGNGLAFGALTALALMSSTATHSAIVIAGLPIATAIISTILNGSRPSPFFWIASMVGTVVVFVVTVLHSEGGLNRADVLLLLAVALGALGYAEGGRVSAHLPGTLVISWGLVFVLPISLPVTLIALRFTENTPDGMAWVGFIYLGTTSMFLGFLPFYRGLADAGVAKASQVQLLQPLLTITWGGLLLGEYVGLGTVVAALAVLSCVVATQRARVSTRTLTTTSR
jgi:drug/metabolite transporter (DMT)-like permease